MGICTEYKSIFFCINRVIVGIIIDSLSMKHGIIIKNIFIRLYNYRFLLFHGFKDIWEKINPKNR